MELSKREFMALYFVCRDIVCRNISRWKGSEPILEELEKKGLVEISFRDGQMYGVIETKEGKEVLEDSKYEEWFEELRN